MSRLLAAATIRGWQLFCSRAPDCVATIRGQPLFEGSVYSKKYGITLSRPPPAHTILACLTSPCTTTPFWKSCICPAYKHVTITKTCYNRQTHTQHIQLKWLPILVAIATERVHQQYRTSMFLLLLTTSDHQWCWHMGSVNPFLDICRCPLWEM